MNTNKILSRIPSGRAPLSNSWQVGKDKFTSPILNAELGLNDFRQSSSLISVPIQRPIGTIIRSRQPVIRVKVAPQHLMPLQRVQTIPEPPKTPELYLPSVYMHNMRSLNLKKFSELKLIAANYDIIAITESWLTAEKEQLYNLDNFTLHHCHRGKKRIGGGVAVYIRSHLNVKKLCSYSNQHVNLLVSLTSR